MKQAVIVILLLIWATACFYLGYRQGWEHAVSALAVEPAAAAIRATKEPE